MQSKFKIPTLSRLFISTLILGVSSLAFAQKPMEIPLDKDTSALDFQEFTEPGSYIWTARTTTAKVKASAAGGGAFNWQGGGGGDYVQNQIVNFREGEIYLIVVGLGGGIGQVGGDTLIQTASGETLLIVKGGGGATEDAPGNAGGRAATAGGVYVITGYGLFFNGGPGGNPLSVITTTGYDDTINYSLNYNTAGYGAGGTYTVGNRYLPARNGYLMLEW